MFKTVFILSPLLLRDYTLDEDSAFCGSTVLTGNSKPSATNFANSHEFFKFFAKIRVTPPRRSVPGIRGTPPDLPGKSWFGAGEETALHGFVPPKTGEPLSALHAGSQPI
jgi:hypothetical protein